MATGVFRMIPNHAVAIFLAMLITFLFVGFQWIASLIQWHKARKQVYDSLHLGSKDGQ
jgi:hypothetical protein